MAGLLGYAAAGAVAGAGAGLVEEGKAARDRAMKLLDQQFRMDVLEETDRRATIREEARDERLAQRELERDQRTAERQDTRDKNLLDRQDALEKSRAEREGGLLQSVQQLEDGSLIGVTRGGQKVELGVRGAPKKAATSDPVVEVQDPDDPDSTIMVPRSQAAGMAGKGTQDMRNARREREEMERADARKQAEKETSEKAGWLSTDATDFADDGGSRSAFTERRTNEILKERRAGGKAAAEKPASEGAPKSKPKEEGGDKAGLPTGGGSRNDPFRATTQAHIEWFKKSAPAGTVIEVDGKLYTKK